ncbi:hypothetical protein GCM10022276_26070 [Sphingomonas limnosediminicola]|uniref:Ice-binding protein C-terminal domain-containing protein n=1 Tax=Sphingomonas limnosediminicola TaxID=940133 RepID=A0ABP7LQ01_9SPHN
MRKHIAALAAGASLTLVATPAVATVTTITTLDGTQGVAAPPGEMNPGSSATITANPALDANGSLQLTGDRTRVLNGNNYVPDHNYGAANDIVSLTGDYLVYDGGSAGVQSPAFRIYVQDGAARSELIWEAAYNGGYTIGTADSVGAGDLFWQYLAGCGYVGTGGCGSGSYIMHTAADWGDLFSADAFISAFGVGQGGGAGATFSALADHVTLTTGQGGAVGYDFAVGQTPSVPEPATWAMMLLGFGGIGFQMRSKRKGALTAA